MNDEIAKQLVRQLKIINFWITLIGAIVIAGLIVLGILLWQVISFVRDTKDSVTHFTTSTQQKLDVKSQVCAGSDSFSQFVKDKTGACN